MLKLASKAELPSSDNDQDENNDEIAAGLLKRNASFTSTSNSIQSTDWSFEKAILFSFLFLLIDAVIDLLMS